MELDIEHALQQGIAAHNAGDLQEAERAYRAILQSQPQHPDASHNLGLIAISANQVEAALPLFKTALEKNPNIEQFWMSYIDALVRNKQLKDAKQAIKKAKKKGFDAKTLQALVSADAYDHYNLGITLKEQGRLDEALASYNQAIALKPDFAEAYNNLGNTLKELGRLDEVLASFTKAITLKPDFAEAHHNLGNALKQLGRLDEAEVSYTRAIALRPDYAKAHFNLGRTLEELGRLEEALASYNQAIVAKPDYTEAHFNLGITLKKLGRLEEALASFDQAIALKPDYAKAYSNLGITLKELGILEEALASFKQAIALKPDFAEAHYNLGITLQDMGRQDKAESCYKKAIALEPDFAEAHYNLGNTLKELGRLEEAQASYNQAIASKADYAEAYDNLGIISYVRGDIDSALVSMDKARSINSRLDTCELFHSIIQARKCRGETDVNANSRIIPDHKSKLITDPLIKSRPVEKELITVLLQMNSRGLDRTSDSRYGNGRCSPDFKLFKQNHPVIKTVAEDLTSILKSALKSDIIIADSFFNILSAGGGSNPHNHLSDVDGDYGLFLGRHKYSLVYYLSVGDQNCSEPGTLKLFDPDEDILPCEGMIVIIPASRKHSAVYEGKKDRIMIGINFYSI